MGEVTRVVDVVDEQWLPIWRWAQPPFQLAHAISGFRSGDGIKLPEPNRQPDQQAA